MAELSEDEMLAQAIAMSLLPEQEQQQQEKEEEEEETQKTSTPQVSSKAVSQYSTLTTDRSSATQQQGPSASKTSAPQKDFLASIPGDLSEEAAKIAQRLQVRVEPSPPTQTTLPPAKLMGEWQPNKECLELIMGMGISENAARRALYNTGNDNAELATAWVFENISDPELHKPFTPSMTVLPHIPEGGPVCHSFDDVMAQMNSEAFKMVLVVNTELRMGVGKTAAQVGHAVLGLYRLLQTQAKWKEDSIKWDDCGSKKIVLQGRNTRHLLELKHRAYELRLPNIIVHDAGKTQVAPGSLTVFATFGRSADVDQVTGSLKLL